MKEHEVFEMRMRGREGLNSYVNTGFAGKK